MLATSKPRARPAPSATLRRGTVITGSNSFRLRHSPPQERVRLGPKWAQLGYGVVCPGGLRSCLLTSARATYRRKPAQAALQDLRVRPWATLVGGRRPRVVTVARRIGRS